MHVQLYVHPRSAGGGLPVTRSMPFSQVSMPPNSQPRNMTGIYLGLEGNIKPPRPKTGIPPLARTRGSSRIRTTAEEQRYQRVELLRIKEEKRGFAGNPVKRHQQPISQNDQGGNSSSSITGGGGSGGGSSRVGGEGAAGGGGGIYPFTGSAAGTLSGASEGGAGADAFHSRRWGPGKRIHPDNPDDWLRPNLRNYTTVANSGLTRSEKLTGWLGGSHHGLQSGGNTDSGAPPGGLAKEVGRMTSQDLAGLEECFKKVCKGNVEVLYSLLPGRKQHQVRRENTGFTVRSYRNPNRAEILADFSVGSQHPLGTGGGTGTGRADRPKTVPIRRPLVPQPYFYRLYSGTHGPLGTASTMTAVQRRLQFTALTGGADDHSGPHYSSSTTAHAARILASPGAGTISRPLTQRLQSGFTRPPPSATRTQPTPRTSHTTSPTGDLEDTEEAKGVQSGESTSRTGQDIEDPAQVASAASPPRAGGRDSRDEEVEEGGAGLASFTPGLHVAVVPSARPLNETLESTATTINTSNTATLDDSVTPRLSASAAGGDFTPRPPEQEEGEEEEGGDRSQETSSMEKEGQCGGEVNVITEVRVQGEDDQVVISSTEDERPRPKLTASNSGADIMLGLETDEGQSAEVEIDTADQEELMPESEVPKGRVRKASITEKVIKTKASEAMAALIKEEAELRQREFEKLLDEHAELVQEISRTPSSENLIQGERDH